MPSLRDVFLFIVGTWFGFVVVNVSMTSLYRAEMPSAPPEVVALGTTFSGASISAAAGAAVEIAYALSSWPAWLVAPFVATLVYVLLVGSSSILPLARIHAVRETQPRAASAEPGTYSPQQTRPGTRYLTTFFSVRQLSKR